jgi:hypothetical protein
MKVEFNNIRNSRKYSNNQRLNMLLYDQWVTEEIREEIKEFLEINKNESTTFQTLWTQQR